MKKLKRRFKFIILYLFGYLKEHSPQRLLFGYITIQIILGSGLYFGFDECLISDIQNCELEILIEIESLQNDKFDMN